MEFKTINSEYIGDDYFVYQISFEGVVRYIGITNNLKRRQSQHQLGLRKRDKALYVRMAKFGDELYCEPLAGFSDRTEAELFEMYLILEDHFSNKFLINDLPKRIKYF